MIRRLSLVLAFAAVSGACPAVSAQDRQGIYLDPQQLPPDTRPGECVTRRVTGPGGAYRWERIECEAQSGWSDFDRWGYGRQPLAVEDGPLRGDRYGGWRPVGPEGDGPSFGADYPVYTAAGRDADGYLVWPGKLP